MGTNLKKAVCLVLGVGGPMKQVLNQSEWAVPETVWEVCFPVSPRERVQELP